MQILEAIKLDKESVLALLSQFDKVFTPPISEQVKLEDYSEKLSYYGYFVLTRQNDTSGIEGFIAYYLNLEGKYAFIPFIGVMPSSQRKGLGEQMIDKLASCLSHDYNKIVLEVRKRNKKAHEFYLRNGFIETEDLGCKWIMTKLLPEVNQQSIKTSSPPASIIMAGQASD